MRIKEYCASELLNTEAQIAEAAIALGAELTGTLSASEIALIKAVRKTSLPQLAINRLRAGFILVPERWRQRHPGNGKQCARDGQRIVGAHLGARGAFPVNPHRAPRCAPAAIRGSVAQDLPSGGDADAGGLG